MRDTVSAVANQQLASTCTKLLTCALLVLQARQAQLQRKAQQLAADAKEDSQYMQSLSAHERELAELASAQQAAIRGHNQNLKSVYCSAHNACCNTPAALCQFAAHEPRQP